MLSAFALDTSTLLLNEMLDVIGPTVLGVNKTRRVNGKERMY